MKKETFTLFTAAVFFFTASPAPALEEEIRIGREDGWRDIIETRNVTVSPGFEGYLDLSLHHGEYRVTEKTELLIHFNTGFEDEAGNYRLVGSNAEVTDRISRLGAGAGLFNGEREGMVLAPGPGAMFSRASVWGDFTIEFWLYPATLEEGETVLLWQGSRLQNGNTVTQEISCSFEDRRLSWEFRNVFIPSGSNAPYTVAISGLSPMVPRRWHHHMLRFDSTIGLLEYLIDGTTEAVTHASASGSEDGTVYLPFIGGAGISEVEIGGRYTGVIDEIRISRSYIADPFILRYPLETGSAMTRVFDLEYSNTLIVSIDSGHIKPGDTDVAYYYRLADVKSAYQAVDAPWVPFEPGTVFPAETRGRYLQILIELYPDGTGLASPSVRELTIRYVPDTPPLPPARPAAEPGYRRITISWSAVADTDIAGYLVYYGYRPGTYFGSDSTTGSSPIDAGMATSLVVDGLENGRLYYFYVVSYDSSDPPHRSTFSREISARPSDIPGKQ